MIPGPDMSRESGVRNEDLEMVAAPEGTNTKSLRAELIDLHRRLGGFERHMGEVRDQLDARLRDIEVTIARGVRLPPWLAPVLTSIAIFLLGHLGATVWWGATISVKVTGIPQLEQRVVATDAHIADVRERLVGLVQRTGEVEKQLAGGTDDRWRKADDVRTMNDLHRLLDERFAGVDRRLTAQEQRSAERDRWWHQLFESGRAARPRP